ncbi:MAG: hypothetical protein AMXMBFR22_06030 [Phycisphaerae bacterium]
MPEEYAGGTTERAAERQRSGRFIIRRTDFRGGGIRGAACSRRGSGGRAAARTPAGESAGRDGVEAGSGAAHFRPGGEGGGRNF